jgi:Uma2 family endonuclease
MATAEALATARTVPVAPPRQGLPVVINEIIRIPPDVVDLDSFCRWAMSNQFPEHGRISYLNGEIWVDLGMEKFYTHNQVKTDITHVLYALVKEAQSGRYLSDGMRLRNDAANTTTEPDGMFVSYAALQEGRVVRVDDPDCLILAGVPEMVLEIVSDTSVNKDTVRLRKEYWQAGILEYWLIDVRGGKRHFALLKHGATGYTATRKQSGGWLKSGVFGKSFRLTKGADPLGDPLFVLEVRD